ncbi:conserved hypothetical protein (apicoplast) [Theileria equi strain WA]|uniref:RNA-binding S4 domain-containing protein n=1 Tax=Theileria equi strain WA TaxID=1537102 RepID=L1L9V9_THEEQ|nr:conserved hypothetical protein [Theileria equi strain WA]EKX71960.1 conserved hypothetical protein [Theileria equi strain WA]|eukprot:XP_025033553.1 conserved hypothetical protein (apicoplast) [Theileria equi strain WA]
MVSCRRSKLKILKKFNLFGVSFYTTKFNLALNSVGKGSRDSFYCFFKSFVVAYNLLASKVNIDRFRERFMDVLKFFKTLKSRLDSILIRSGLFLTINQVRQSVSHGHVFVNSTVARTSAYIVRDLDVIHMGNISGNVFKLSLFYNSLFNVVSGDFLYSRVIKHVRSNSGVKELLVGATFRSYGLTVCVKSFKVKVNSKACLGGADFFV